MSKLIPLGSQRVRIGYQYGKSKGYFHIGQLRTGEWWWDALGNNGRRETANLAIEAARVWIKESRTVNFTHKETE